MTYKLTLSRRAEADLAAIWISSADRWGVDQTERYLLKLQKSLIVITENPLSGVECDQIRVGYRKFASGSHVLFYRIASKVVLVTRILHVRMDFGPHLQ